VSQIAKWLKGISALRMLRMTPGLKKGIGSHLWNLSYYAGTVGDMSADAVGRCIENRKQDAQRPQTQASHGCPVFQVKAASDRAIGNRKLLLQSKLGARCVKTSNRRPGNSRSCVRGETVAKEPKDRVHVCPSCKLVADRDYVSANIVTLSRGPGRISPDVGNAKSCAARAVARSVVLMHQAVEAAPRMGNLPWRARPVSNTGHSPPASAHEPQPFVFTSHRMPGISMPGEGHMKGQKNGTKAIFPLQIP